MAFVPQGLPATVTMLLTFAAMRLKDRNVLVKDLTAVSFFFSLRRPSWLRGCVPNPGALIDAFLEVACRPL